MTPRVTVLQLDTGFPRIPGDVACPVTYRGKPTMVTIPRASVAQVVRRDPSALDIAPFETAARGATGSVLATSCGFLAPWQDRLAKVAPVPVVASALGALERAGRPGDLEDMTPTNTLILTFDAEALGPAHLGARPDFAASVIGLPVDNHLRRVIAEDLRSLDTLRAEREVADLLRAHLRPGLRHLLLECTNLPPYKAALRAVADLRITDILTEIERTAPGAILPRFL